VPKGPKRAIGRKADPLGSKVCALHNPCHRAGLSQRGDESAGSRASSYYCKSPVKRSGGVMNVDLTQAGYVDSLVQNHLTGAVECEDGRRFVVSLIREKKPILPLGNWLMGEAVIQPNILSQCR